MGSNQSLKRITFRRKYNTFEENIIGEFFEPCFNNAISYDEITGFFSSKVFIPLFAGLKSFISNNGRIRLLIGVIPRKDLKVINATDEELVEQYLNEFIDDLGELGEISTDDHLKLLAWLIYNNVLEIRLAFLQDASGNFLSDEELLNRPAGILHQKIGYFYDKEGNSVSFSGSLNFTYQAVMLNLEEFKVFNNWEPVKKDYWEEDRKDFDIYWNEEKTYLKIIKLPNEILTKITQHAPESVEDINFKNIIEFYERLRKETLKEIEEKTPIDRFGFTFPKIEDFILTQKASFLKVAPSLGDSWKNLCETITFEPMWHQRIVATLIYQNFPWGYILADEVGLGKTIEAGLGVKWLLLTNQIKRVLIIVPKGILRQWQEELKEKFNLEFWIYDGKSFINYWRNSFTPKNANPWNAVNLVLVSSGLIRRPERAEILLQAKEWDMVLIDEAHHLRRKPPKRKTDIGLPTLLLKLALELQYHTRGMLLMTATPIQMKIRELFDLLDLLGLGGNWANYENFQKYYNQLFLPPEEKDWNFLVEMAKDSVRWGRVEVEQFRKYLEESALDYSEEIIRILLEDDDLNFYSDKFSSDFWNEFSQALGGLTPLSWYMFRFTRDQLKKYKIQIAERKPKDISVKMIPEEMDLYDRVEEYIKDIYKNLDETKRTVIGFTLAIYRRRLTSSFQAILKSLERRSEALQDWIASQSLSRMFEDDDIDDEISDTIDEATGTYLDITSKSENISEEKIPFPLAKDSVEEEIEYLSKFTKKIREFLVHHDESKLKNLFATLKKANEEDAKRILIFTQYTDTLDFLKRKLIENREYQTIGCFSGRGGELYIEREGNGDKYWKDISKETIKEWFFREADTFKIMLCTDAASEGLNFHICFWLVNYDLPWNPMKVEQRIGRIDRVKQVSPVVKVRNLLYSNTIEGDIYFRLRQRISLFKNVIGPLQPILQEFFNDLEKIALIEDDHRLSDTEFTLLLDRLAAESQIAIEKHEFIVRLIHFRINWIRNFDEETNGSFKSTSLKPFFMDLAAQDSTLQIINIKDDKADCCLNSSSPLLPLHENKNLKFYKTTKLQNLPEIEIALTAEESKDNLDAHWFNYGNSVFLWYLKKWTNYADKFPCIAVNSDKTPEKSNIVLFLAYNLVTDYKITKFIKVTYVIPNWEITRIELIGSLEELGEICDALKLDLLMNKRTLSKYLKKNNLNVEIIKTQIQNFKEIALSDSSLINPSKFSRFIPSESKKLESWLSTRNLIMRGKLKKFLTEWLMMEYLYLKRDEDWDTLEENMPLGKYFEDFITRQSVDLEFDREKLENVITEFDIYFDEIILTKDNEIFRRLKELFGSLNKRKLLRANQPRLRQQIALLLEEWTRIKVLYQQNLENIEKETNKDPEVTIRGVIIYPIDGNE